MAGVVPGYPTGRKWELTRQQPGTPKFIICNADEGDPGAFMDRTMIEGDPHRLLEGMLIAARAIGASRGYIYVRAEYPLAVKTLRRAITQAQEHGVVGRNILGSGMDFDLTIKEGAGAFVCGEETALIHSIEGKRGMPRMRPPYPSESGLWGCPTNINNVETYCSVPSIILNGPGWFAGLGTARSGGTKAFALTGAIKNSGLVEVPIGMTLRQLIFDLGDGCKDTRTFKAVQLGGPSGGCLPADLLDTRIDYEDLQATGAIMGSGGMVVVDHTTCMVDFARFFLTFTQNESCGKCLPCRVGTRQLLHLLTRITHGQAGQPDLDRLRRLCDTVRLGSLCGLGQTAPNPIFTTMRYFQEEYLAHIVDKRCPAGVCPMRPRTNARDGVRERRRAAAVPEGRTAMATLTIDGKTMQVRPGTTVLEAALAHGIDIPRLCYHPELAPSGGCRLCLVEVEGHSTPQPSCGLRCAEGMVVHTQSDQLTRLRRDTIDLFVSDHPLRCVVCDKNGACDLQRYAYQYGVAETSYEFELSRSLFQDDNPFFVRDHQYCILCAKCVRVCDEVVGAHAIDLVGRGFTSHVATPFDGPMINSSCVFCGNCVQVCPTAALLPVSRLGKGREWELTAPAHDLRLLWRRLRD